jgi:GntR family transcriptional regulator
MLAVDKMSRTPIYEQIVDGVKREIITGLLKERDQLPSIRELSVLLSTNPNTVQKAFVELDRAGIIVSTPGRGCFVAEGAIEKIRESLSNKIEEIKELTRMLVNAGVDENAVIEAVRSVYKANN